MRKRAIVDGHLAPAVIKLFNPGCPNARHPGHPFMEGGPVILTEGDRLFCLSGVVGNGLGVDGDALDVGAL
jgi:hypothetical protein